jgi:two-component system phosphate regulon sensor histidine kinase PhoR
MNKKAILIIIGLMGAALLGIGWLQVNWIRFSIRLNEEQFDKNVFAALSKVSERLEYEEQLEFYNFMNNGYVRSYIENKMRQKIQDGEVTVSFSFENTNYPEPNLTKEDLFTIFISEPECDCTNCREDRVKDFSRLMQYYEVRDYTAIAERIRLDRLDEFITQAMADQGIKIDYRYGVFSKRKRSFVIADNHYVVEDDAPQVTKEGYKNLYISKYRVNLFQMQNGQSPGLLMVYFPTRASYVWGSVWKNLLGAILFTGVILFCFAYTIQVIFRQKKLSEMKTDFINNMTHEFKTPIATISLAADSISNRFISENPDKVRFFADKIRQENKRMNEQVEKVLQIALLDKRDFQLKMTEINLHDIIRSAVENISLQVEKRDGKAYAEMNAEEPYIEGDLTHISNIVNNLLDNANKYSPDTPEISVHTRNVNNGVELTVKDNGVGMSKEAKKHIFDKFYRVHTGNRHDVKGFGLGLSYVKTMMTAHKGTIQVKSELGEGSSFILFFPFKQSD